MKSITETLHAIKPDALTGAVSTPIYQTSTFVQEAPGEHRGFDYARSNNPTRKALEDLVAGLESGDAGFAFASGLAAIDAVLKLLSYGDEIIAVNDIYGGSYRIFTHIYQKFGITVKYVDTSDLAQLNEALSSSTRLIWLESPTNPTLKISDIAAISQLAKKQNALLVVDNTFASPVLQRPIELGADIVIHSATKYLAGHSDLIAGLVVTGNAELSAKIKFIQNSSGGILGPFDSWLCIRGIETLHLRVERQCSNAQLVAEFLEGHPAIGEVFYPGLKSHKGHEVAARQQSAFGAVISFNLKEDTEEAAKNFIAGSRYFLLAESLGGIKSLCCHPATMTHKSVPVETRLAAGISPSLIRLSVGIEEAADLIADLEGALQEVPSRSLVS